LRYLWRNICNHNRAAPALEKDPCLQDQAQNAVFWTVLHHRHYHIYQHQSHRLHVTQRARAQLHPQLAPLLQHLDLLEQPEWTVDPTAPCEPEYKCDECHEIHAEGECENSPSQRYCRRCGQFGHYQMQCALGPLDEATGKTNEPVQMQEHACRLCHRFNCSYHSEDATAPEQRADAQQQSWPDHKGAFVDTQAFQTERMRPLRIPFRPSLHPPRQADQTWGLGNDHRLPCETCGTLLYSFEATGHRFCCQNKPALKVEPPALPPNWQEFINAHPQLQQKPRLFNHMCSPVAFATSKRDNTPCAEVQLHGRAYARVIPLQSSRIHNTLGRVSKEPAPPASCPLQPNEDDDTSDMDDDDDNPIFNDESDLLLAPTLRAQPPSQPPTPFITSEQVTAATTDRIYNVNNPARMYIFGANLRPCSSNSIRTPTR
jgi:hypothetical protein